MKILYLGLFLSFLWLFQAQPVYAQLPPTPVQPTPSMAPAQTTKADANDTIEAIRKFVTSTDSLLGGFIFYTPDIFADSIELKDGTILPGLAAFRDIFYAISIPVVAIAISFFAIQRLKDDNPYAFKPFLTKLFLVAILFLITPTMLSYSIQANNLLVQKITSEQKFSQFITEFLDNEQEQIQKGADPQDFGIPNTQPNFFQSFWKTILQSVLYLITILFFLIGFLFIAFQFIIRFASLLFLSVLFPIAIPFALSEKTEGITNMYFKTWFTFLIHQPAFALGYMLATSFLSAILATNGASLGMLFFYSGFLFFLGGVNTLVSSVFGSSWTAIGSNVAAGMLARPFNSRANEFRKGIMGGNPRSISNVAGLQVRNQAIRGFGAVRSKIGQYRQANRDSNPLQGNQNNKGFVSRKDLAKLLEDSNTTPAVPTQSTKPNLNTKQSGNVYIKDEGYAGGTKKKSAQAAYVMQPTVQTEGYKPNDLRATKDKQTLSPGRTKGALQKERIPVKKRDKQTKDKIKRINLQEPL